MSEPFVAVPMEELNYFWVIEDEVPCFIGDVEDITKHADTYGYEIYYVLANREVTTKGANNVVHTSYEPSTWKVINTFVGRAIVPADGEIALTTLETNAWYSLPKIPWELVQRIDTFFRAVDKKHSTESIVILTFDSTKDDSSGWGVLVPNQENSAVDCDYDPTSVAEAKSEAGEHINIVGSVHSHPDMSAYASHTDHKDQATFPGIHITHGWSNKTGGVTEYHIEFMMGGYTWEFKPEQVFANMPQPEIVVDEEIEEWMSKVKPATKTFPKAGSGTFGSTSSPGGHSSGSGNAALTRITLPSDAPSLDDTIIIGEIARDSRNCLLCDGLLIGPELDKRRCLSCHSYLLLPEETIANLLEVQAEYKLFAWEIDPSQKPDKAIVIWRKTEDGKNVYENVYTPESESTLGKS